jgi:P27 family predicted phage terminase small subunit
MPGPRKTPTPLRLLRGNPGKEAIPRGEPHPLRPDRVPDPPQRLADEAREEWLRIAPELHRLGLLTVADLQSLAAYCIAYGRWCEAEDTMAAAKAEDPHSFGLIVSGAQGQPIANPAFKIARDAARDMMRYATEFGFTPASRTRISGTASADESDSKFGGLLASQ